MPGIFKVKLGKIVLQHTFIPYREKHTKIRTVQGIIVVILVKIDITPYYELLGGVTELLDVCTQGLQPCDLPFDPFSAAAGGITGDLPLPVYAEDGDPFVPAIPDLYGDCGVDIVFEARESLMFYCVVYHYRHS